MFGTALYVFQCVHIDLSSTHVPAQDPGVDEFYGAVLTHWRGVLPDISKNPPLKVIKIDLTMEKDNSKRVKLDLDDVIKVDLEDEDDSTLEQDEYSKLETTEMTLDEIQLRIDYLKCPFLHICVLHVHGGYFIKTIIKSFSSRNVGGGRALHNMFSFWLPWVLIGVDHSNSVFM